MANNSLDRVCFGVREQIEGGPLEFVVLAFDFKRFLFSRFTDGIERSVISFAEFQVAQTNGTVLVIQFRTNPASRYETLSMEDCANIYSLITTIIENIHETLNPKGGVISSECQKLQPKICLRKVQVIQKSFKRKGKVSGLNKLKLKKRNATPATPIRPIGFLLLTDTNLLCFEDENSVNPLCIYPACALHLAPNKSDDVSFSLEAAGDKGVFQIITQSAESAEERSLWLDACAEIPKITPEIVSEIYVVIKEILQLYRGKWDKENEEHVNYLVRLWEASKLGKSDDGLTDIEFSIQCNRWKDLGFQRDDPISDLRATGLLGLQNLVYFAEHYPGIFMQMARNQQQSSEMEYPFSTAGINISFLLIELLGVKRDEYWFPTVQTHPMFFYNRNAWQELFTIVFRCFDQKWNQMLVGYMGFQQVIESTREDIKALLLRKSMMGVPHIFDMLGIYLEDIENFKSDITKKNELAKCKFDRPSATSHEPQPPTSSREAEPKLSESPRLKDSSAEGIPTSDGDAPPAPSAHSESPSTEPAPTEDHPTPEPVEPEPAPEQMPPSSEPTVENPAVIVEEKSSQASQAPVASRTPLDRPSFQTLPTPSKKSGWKATNPSGSNVNRRQTTLGRMKSNVEEYSGSDSGMG